MSDEQAVTANPEEGATPESPAVNPDAQSGATPQAASPESETPEQLKARLDSAEARIKELNKENEKRRRQQDEAEKAALAEQGKFKELFEQSQSELNALRNELAAKERAIAVRDVASEFNLPAELAARLKGDSIDELRADAKELAKFAQPRREPPPSEAQRSGAPQPGVLDDSRRAELATRFRIRGAI